MRRCPDCQCEIPDHAPGGYCPRCALEFARHPQAARQPAPTGSLPDPSGELDLTGVRPEDIRGTIPGLEILDLIGSGGMGAVYRARQTDLDRVVAVKVLPPHLGSDPRFVERFRREARAMARLDHPNIVTVYDSGIREGRAYIVMEFIEGTNLRGAMSAGAIDPAAALRIVPAICDGLAYAHAAGVVHRDIKPENVLLGTGDRVKIVDFGLAKWLDGADIESSLTATGTRMGTIRYMAPEQFDGGDVDARADIYSLGVMLYELLTGEVPMGAFRMPSETIGTDPRIDQVIDKTLQRRPADRYQSVDQFGQELSSIGLLPAQADRPTPRRRPATFATDYGKTGGVRYESPARIFGLPVLSVALGADPVTGQPGTAKGIIAVGDKAVGGLAVGGASVGVVAFGGAAIGINAFGGAAIGLQTAFGGAAIGGGIALGGAAIGLVALGGASLGVVVLQDMPGSGLPHLASIRDVLNGGRAGNPVEETLGYWASLPETPWVLDAILAQALLGPLLAVLLVALVGWTRHLNTKTDAAETSGATQSSGHEPFPLGSLGSLVMPILACVIGFVVAVVLNHLNLPI